MSELLSKLARLYGAGRFTADVWGRRPALPSEIEAALINDQSFDALEPHFQPTNMDLAEKGDNDPPKPK
jgi:CRISPR/Cas system CMR subunit Cmr6 (Cas7 group RAMP superfamily)